MNDSVPCITLPTMRWHHLCFALCTDISGEGCHLISREEKVGSSPVTTSHSTTPKLQTTQRESAMPFDSAAYRT